MRVISFMEGRPINPKTLMGNTLMVPIDVGLTAEFDLVCDSYKDMETDTLYEFYSWHLKRVEEA